MGKWWTQYGFPRWGSSSSAQRFLLGHQSRLSAVPFGKWSCHLSCFAAAFLSCHGIGGFCLWKIPCLAAAGLCDDLIAQQRSKHARNSFPKGKPALFLLSSPLLLEKKIGVKGQVIGKWWKDFFPIQVELWFWDSLISYIFPKRLRVP